MEMKIFKSLFLVIINHLSKCLLSIISIKKFDEEEKSAFKNVMQT